MSKLLNSKGKFFVLCAIFFIGLVIIAPFLLEAPKTFDLTKRFCPPSATDWLGCDHQGNDLLTSLAYGGRISFFIGISALIINILIGLSLGTIASFLGGWFDFFIMRMIDILMAFPGILLAIFISALLGPGTLNIIIAITLTGWTSTARLVRGEIISIKEQDFIHAQKAIGSSWPRVLFRHIFPHILPLLLIHSSFMLSSLIITESSLSFLGLAHQEKVLSWGGLLSAGKNYLLEAPSLAIYPGVCIMLVIIMLNFLGDNLRDYLDPQSS
jgi:ABC-type dipeptide/oligopeptide/nickel transport system permease subunit